MRQKELKSNAKLCPVGGKLSLHSRLSTSGAVICLLHIRNYAFEAEKEDC